MSRENLSSDIRDLHTVGQELFELIKKIEADPENRRIDPVDFINYTKIIDGREANIFPEAEVKADIKRVKEIQEDILRRGKNDSVEKKETEARAALVESMLPQLIRELSWLGDRVKVINSSLYDDYCNKIDGAVQLLPDREIKDENDIRCVGFSIDFTLSLEESHKKVFDQAISLCQGYAPKMKYFKTDIVTNQGLKTIKLRDFKIPRVVLACSGKVIDDSMDDFTAYEESDDPAVKERLNNCDLKFYFIRETVSQLIFFAELIEKFIELEEKEGNDRVLIDKYKRMRNMYDNAYGELVEIVKSLGYDGNSIKERIKNIPSPTNNFDLNTSEGKRMVDIIRVMAKPKK